MDDPYKELVNVFTKSMKDIGELIFSLAQRTLSGKEFQEYIEEWQKKTQKKTDGE